MGVEKKVKNNAVEFWRIILTIAVTFFHFNLFSRLRCMGDTSVFGNAIISGGWVLGYFLFLTGYFMMASFARKEQKGLIDHTNAYKPAWGYFWSRVKGLMPAYFIGTLFVFIVRNIAVKTPISQIPVLFFRSIFEFLGLYQLGLLGINDVTSNTDLANMIFEATTDTATYSYPSGIRAGIVASNTPLWNGPGWYISAIIIVSVIIYWVLCKNKDFFLGIFCPACIIVCYGFYGLVAEESWNNTTSNVLGVPDNLIRVLGGLCIGCLMYYVVEWIKEKKITQKHKVVWNIFSVVIICFLCYTMWNGTSWNEVQNNVVLLPFTVIVLVGDDVISKFLSGPLAGVSAFVGKLSLYWYISHWGLVYLIPAMYPEMEYLPMAGIYVVSSFVVAFVLMLIDDKLIKPYITMRPKKADT